MSLDQKVAQLYLLAEDMSKIYIPDVERLTEAKANNLRGLIYSFQLRAKAILTMEIRPTQPLKPDTVKKLKDLQWKVDRALICNDQEYKGPSNYELAEQLSKLIDILVADTAEPEDAQC